METLLWLIVIILFALSFIGLLFPIIPSVIAIWLGFIIYHFFINDMNLTLVFWLIMIVLTVILIISDFIASKYFVNTYGGSKKGEYSVMVGLIFVDFVLASVFIIILFFIIVLIVKLVQQKTGQEALRSAICSLIGFLSSMVVKVILQSMMIIIFIIYLIF